MTREEREDAINFLKGYLDEEVYTEKCRKAHEMAIKALEQEPCEDCVSRNAIIKTLNEMDRYIADELTLCDNNNKFPQNEVFIVDDVYEEIEQLSPVTPKLKIGKWINTGHKDRDGLTVYRCSECEHAPLMYVHTLYCPWCGAKMEER